ncbi:hypothetical protein BCR34DRAFT_587361 [Clohesyomyces aquaticus]|uniref:Ubiquitin-like domain-containing protein n=1 Tax=Clohesyomyces aquaticus TaxID=1231657 RepID=A0A1Y1ZPP0_9PLEO|nr:hypothetical protein BCR34DRAFT_587361 [Clohesyomyces aquaticus]
MADPISLTASVVTLTSTAKAALETLYNFSIGLVGARNDFRAHELEIASLENLFKDIEAELKKQPARPSTRPKDEKIARAAVELCNEILPPLDTLLRHLTELGMKQASESPRKLNQFLLRVQWYLTHKKKIVSSRDTLRIAITTLQRVLGTMRAQSYEDVTTRYRSLLRFLLLTHASASAPHLGTASLQQVHEAASSFGEDMLRQWRAAETTFIQEDSTSTGAIYSLSGCVGSNDVANFSNPLVSSEHEWWGALTDEEMRQLDQIFEEDLEKFPHTLQLSKRMKETTSAGIWCAMDVLGSKFPPGAIINFDDSSGIRHLLPFQRYRHWEEMGPFIEGLYPDQADRKEYERKRKAKRVSDEQAIEQHKAIQDKAYDLVDYNDIQIERPEQSWDGWIQPYYVVKLRFDDPELNHTSL